MSEWRSKLGDIIKGEGSGKKGKPSQKGSEDCPFRLFINQTVLPAFRQLKSEIERHERKVDIQQQDGETTVTLYVLSDDKTEFSYTVRCLKHKSETFAYPHMNQDGEELQCRARVELPGGNQKARDIKEFSKESIIEDFLNAYEKSKQEYEK